jgi:hypothetical protein
MAASADFTNHYDSNVSQPITGGFASADRNTVLKVRKITGLVEHRGANKGLTYRLQVR